MTKFDYGIKTWVTSCGVCDFTVRFCVLRLAKDEEYPNGRFLMTDTDKE